MGTRAYRRYSDEEKALALTVVAMSGSYKQAGRSLGIPWTTLREWHKGTAVNDSVAQIRAGTCGALVARLEEKINLLVDAVDAGRIAEAGLIPVTTALRVLVDRMIALREADAPTPEELEEEQREAQRRICREVAVVVRRHVEDPEKLAVIALELEGLYRDSGRRALSS